MDQVYENQFDHESYVKNINVQNRLYDWVKSTFCKICLRFVNHRRTVNKQQAQFKVVDLLASIGGSVGLWIGWSALTLVETLSLIVIICGCFRTKEKDKVTSMQNA